MREASLPSPGITSLGYHLRRVCAKAISYIEKNSRHYPSGIHPEATQLRAFFVACADALTPYDATPLVDNDA